MQNYIVLFDGRKLAYEIYGDSSGYPFIYSHGAPGSHKEALFYDAKAKQMGLKVIAVNRAGYGGSDYNSDRSFTSYAKDITELVNQLNVNEFSVIGWGGGAAYSLALLSKLEDRVKFAILISCITVMTSIVSDEFGMSNEISAKELEDKPKTLVTSSFMEMLLESRNINAELLLEIMSTNANSSDKELLLDENIREKLLASYKEALNEKYVIRKYDEIIENANWDFEIETIKQRVHIVHGTKDTEYSIENSNNLSFRLENSVYHKLKDRGHLINIGNANLILALAKKEADNASKG